MAEKPEQDPKPRYRLSSNPTKVSGGGTRLPTSRSKKATPPPSLARTLVKNSRFILYVFVLGGMIFAMISGFGIFGAPTLEEQLERSAQQFNRSLPKEIREDLHLRFVSAGPGEVLTYHFKLPLESRDEIDIEALTAEQSALLEANFAESEEWATLRERGVEIRYQFADQGRVPFLTLSTHRPPFDPREGEPVGGSVVEP